MEQRRPTSGGHEGSGGGRPRSRTGSAIVQFDQDPHHHGGDGGCGDECGGRCSPSTCRVSECWSPTGFEDMAHGLASRPLGGLEKVIEYRTVPNGNGVELRRVTPSADGPVEHVQVLQPQQPPQQQQQPFVPQPAAPWLDYEGPPAQQATYWGGQQNGSDFQQYFPPPPPQPLHHGYRRLAMNGSQPCLMIAEAGSFDNQSQQLPPPLPPQMASLVNVHPGGPSTSYQQQPQQPPQLHHSMRQRSLPRSSTTTGSNKRQGHHKTAAAAASAASDSFGQPPLPREPSSSSIHAQPPAAAASRSGSTRRSFSRTSSMGRLDPPLGISSGSQPCLLVAQTVSNRRRQHQKTASGSATATTSKPTSTAGSSGGQQKSHHRSKEGGGGGTTGSMKSTKSEKKFQRSESFHSRSASRLQHHQQMQPPQDQQQEFVDLQFQIPPPPQPHFFVEAATTLLPPPQSSAPRTPSMSPLAVVRNKRANQANWEKVQRKNSLAAIGKAASEASAEDTCVPSGSLNLTPLLGSSSCTRRASTEDDEQDTVVDHRGREASDKVDRDRDQGRAAEVTSLDDIDLPPPPSPPCTCGKNLELPPTPPMDGEAVEMKSGALRYQHHPHCTEVDSQASLDMAPGPCGFSGGGRASSGGPMSAPILGGFDSLRGRGGPPGGGGPEDSIDVIDSSKEKTVNFANCVSPPSPHDPGFLGINNESYPCDCCQLDESQFRRSFSHHGQPCVPSMMESFHGGGGGVSNGVCSNGIGGKAPATSKTASLSRSSRSDPRDLGGGRGDRDRDRDRDEDDHHHRGRKPRKPFFSAKFSEHERGISLEFGKFVALISISGVRFRRQHWCLLSIVLLIVVLCIAIGLPISTDDIPPTPEARLAAVRQLLKEVPLIDGHNDLPWNIRKFIHNKLNTVNFTSNLKTETPWGTSAWSHTDLSRLSHGGVGGQLWVAYAPCGSQHKDAVQVTLEQIDLIKRFVNQYPTRLQFVNDSTALVEAHAEGRIASLISVESGHSIGTSLAVLRMFHRLGAVSLTLTHNCNTPWADCSNVDKAGRKPEHNGLSSFGKTVIKELNRLGMIIDLSHSSHKTSLDALETSEAPVIFSHSSAFALCNSTRNVQDDVLKLVAKKRGLVMVNFFSYFLTCSNTSTINDVVAHLNHIRMVAGIDSVGIGASYDGINAVPRGLEDVSQYPELLATLLASGMWTMDDLKKLAGLNFLRVFKEVEQVSLKLRPSKGPSEDHIDAESIKDHISCRNVAKRDSDATPC